MSSKRYTAEEFVSAWNTSSSMAEVARKLGLAAKGGNYHTLNRLSKKYELTKEHMTGQGWLGGKTHDYSKRPLEEILVEGRPHGSHSLKLRLIKDGVFEHMCYACFLREWRERPIPLELEHINGVHDDNRLKNLTLLCPNCHALTPTYRGKNQARVGQRRAGALKTPDEDLSIVGSTPITRTCACGNVMQKNSNQCKTCYQSSKKTKIDWPSNDELLAMLRDSNYSAVSRKLGVSDNAIRKRLSR